MTANELTAGQVAILKSLAKSTAKQPLSRGELKTAVGIKGAYSGGWLNQLWALSKAKLILIVDKDGRHFHSITAAGAKALAALKNGAA